MRSLSIIVALDESGGFGKNGKIPWNYPEDLKHFQQTTSGGICIMGRRTYQDMLDMKRDQDKKNGKGNKPINKILPGRESYVLTTSEKEMPGAIKATRLREVVEQLNDDDKREIFVIGGFRLFVEALAWADTIYVTIVPGYHDCDIKFPLKAFKKFQATSGDVKGNLRFIKYKRVSN